MGGDREEGGVLGRQQLEEGIEGEVLDAGGTVDLRPGDAGERAGGHAEGALVTVMDGVTDEGAGVIEETEVGAPGVDRDATRRRGGASGGREGQANLVEEAEGIPVKSAREADRLVREAVDFVEGDARSVEATEEGAAALGAEVDGEIGGGM